jgi:hypothetical protein
MLGRGKFDEEMPTLQKGLENEEVVSLPEAELMGRN